MLFKVGFGGARVVVLSRLHAVNEESGNALLKFLEEPPSGTLILATSRDVASVLDDDSFAVSRAPGGAVLNLARAAEEAGARFVHYSTDFVFDGAATTPYTEDVRPSPRGTYAASKLLGEWFALEAPQSYVLRVESLFGSPANWTGRRGTLDGIAANLEQGREVRAFSDRIVSPGYVVDIAAATRHLALSGAEPGLYHCVNSGHASWYDVAREVASLIGSERPNITPVTMDQSKLKAPRPRYCALSVAKLEAAGFRMPAWQDALRRWLATRGALTT